MDLNLFILFSSSGLYDMSTAIPLENDEKWWWYLAKSKLLSNLIKNHVNLQKKLNILEIGPGKGNNLEVLNTYGEVDLLETEEEFILFLNKYKSKSFNQIYKEIRDIKKEYDLIVLLDVLEHIQHSREFMDSLSSILKKHGTIIIGVPAYQTLWSIHDEVLKHYRRYNWELLEKDTSSFKIVYKTGFNYLLLPIRFLQLKLMRNIHNTNQTGKFLNLVFLQISNIEFNLRRIKLNPKFGLSIYAVLKKIN